MKRDVHFIVPRPNTATILVRSDDGLPAATVAGDEDEVAISP